MMQQWTWEPNEDGEHEDSRHGYVIGDPGIYAEIVPFIYHYSRTGEEVSSDIVGYTWELKYLQHIVTGPYPGSPDIQDTTLAHRILEDVGDIDSHGYQLFHTEELPQTLSEAQWQVMRAYERWRVLQETYELHTN